MNLLYDLKATQPNPSGKYHGGGKYAEVVFFKMIEKEIKFACFFDSSKWINPKILDACEKNSIKLFDLQRISVLEIVKQNNITQIYSALPGNLKAPCRIIGTIHGLRQLELQFDWNLFLYKKSMRYILSFIKNKLFRKSYCRHFINKYGNSDFNIITVSNHSKYSILSYFPDLKNKEIKVLYSPSTSKSLLESHIAEADGKYILIVSANRWDKNNLRAIEAFDRLLSLSLVDKNIKMKVTGAVRNNFRYKINNPNNFEFLGYVSEEKLEELYSKAYLFVYPSLNEGFGYPPIEAMKYGVPVIASPFTSISEICGNAALYFNPYSIEEIMNRMLVIMNPEIYEDYSLRSYKRYNEVRAKQEHDLDELINIISK